MYIFCYHFTFVPFNKKISKKIIAFFSAFVLISTGVLVSFQNSLIGEKYKTQYNVTGIVYPFHEMLLAEYEENPKSQIIQEISTYVDIQNASTFSDGEKAFWKDVYIKVDNNEKYKTMFKNYIELVNKHPDIFIKNRIKTFNNSMSHWDSNNELTGVIESGNLDFTKMNLNKFFYVNQLTFNLRSRVLKILYGNTGNQHCNSLIRFSYYTPIPIVLLLILFICYLIDFRKKLFDLLLIGSLLFQTLIIFFTTPAEFFMYYFPMFICGYVLYFYWILKKFE